MLLLLKRYLTPFLFLVLLSSASSGQTTPYLSAPVNGSTWETTTPTLYWWYLPTPYVTGPYDYNVQVSTNSGDFTGSNLLVNATVTTIYGAGNYTVNNSVGLIQGATYYWRVGINGNYSAVWSFMPYTGGGTTNYTINAGAGTNGTISPSGTVTVTRGSSQTFTIVPDQGYAVQDVIVDNISVGALTSYTFDNITASHLINATFIKIYALDTTFVSMLGHDANGDGSRLHPYRTIQRGHDRSKPGHVVAVLDGVYDEDVVLTKAAIKIIGLGTPSTSSFLVRANDVTIKNFNVERSSPGPGIQKVGLETYDHLDKLTLENITSKNNAEKGLLLENIDSVEVKDCIFNGNDMGGISIINCNHLSFTNIFLKDNLRGFAAYGSNNITINQLNAIDQGKSYLAQYPDFNGLFFSECNNISLTAVTSNFSKEAGIKFEDCSQILMNGVYANNNKDDGIIFLESDHIRFNTGTASRNGLTVDHHGIEIVGCDYIEFNNVAANENASTGILIDLFYTGLYKWWPGDLIPVPPVSNYYDPSAELKFTDVSACSNGGDGLYAIHLGYAEFNNVNFSNNAQSGFELDAAHDIAVIGGTFDGNLNGVVLAPTINVHPIAPKLSSDEIVDFSFTGTGSISNNLQYGILIAPAAGTKLTTPLFYGSYEVFENELYGLKINGNVENAIFSGLYFKSIDDGGVLISDLNPGNKVTGLKINDCYFDGFGTTLERVAISLFDGALLSAGNVDGKNNIFVGALTNQNVEDQIIHKVDVPAYGLVTFTGWTNGQPAIKIGSASAYTGSLVTIPVKLDISATPLSFTQLFGKITFNEHKLRFKYVSYGAGTIIQDAGWGVLFDHSVTDELRLMAFGFNAVNYSGTLFTITFEVADGVDGSAVVQGLATDWSINGGIMPFVVYDGTITYSASTATSITKGDATLDFTVDSWDWMAVYSHINGITLTGQSFLNADVNKDMRVDELDAADIMTFVNTGIWPSTAAPALGELTFAASSVDQQGVLRFPITVYNSSNVRTLQVDLTYDDTKIDFRNFRQLMQGSNYFVEAKSISRGTARLLFTSSEKTSGTIVPAELFFTLKSAGSTAGLISSVYSVNGAALKPGPSYGSSSVTEVEAEEIIPTTFAVEQNYPNPFNPSTTIKYSLPKASVVTIRIYDVLGSLVKTLVNSEMPAGTHRVIWNGDNSYGSQVVSGPYFYQVVSGNDIATRKMLLIK